MNMTFDIPHDVQTQVAGIPDLDQRVALFLRHEAQLEIVRRQRHSPEARAMAGRALSGAGQYIAAGLDREKAFEELQAIHRDITGRL